MVRECVRYYDLAVVLLLLQSGTCCLAKSFLFYYSMETITLGDKRIGIKTSVLEEKATACNMLCCYADELKEGFFPWIDQVFHSGPCFFLAWLSLI